MSAFSISGVQPLPRGELAAAHGGNGPRDCGQVPGAATGQPGHRAHAGHNRRRPRAQQPVQVQAQTEPRTEKMEVSPHHCTVHC